MPIKKLRFSFDVPLTSLLGLIAAGQADMHIDVVGDDKPVPLSKLLGSGGVAGLLEPPRERKKRGPMVRATDAEGKPTTALDLMLAAMANTPDHRMTSTELKPILIASGLAANSVSPQLTAGFKRGWFEKLGHGSYQLTPAGVAECEKRGFDVFQEPAGKPGAANKTKAKGAAAHAPVKSNGAAHHA